MRRFGFKTFDALDPSEGMLEIAKEKGLYRNYICKAIDKGQLNLPAGISKNVVLREDLLYSIIIGMTVYSSR